MKPIKRSTFLKQSAKAGAFLAFRPLYPALFDQPMPANNHTVPDGNFLLRLVNANDENVAALLQTSFDSLGFSRTLGYYFTALTAAYCSPASIYYQQASLVPALHQLSQLFIKAQTADGTVNVGNLESPPDTAFLVELITAAMVPLEREKGGGLNAVKENVKMFLLRAGDGLTTGGVHTPNHRWVISAALARIHALYPAKKYLQRINEWLAEGIYINSDGNYPERSRIYSYVENQAFVAMARLLNRPDLLQPVRKNLEATYYYMEPNGDLVTVDSRRQDQYTGKNILEYYPLYRYLAIRDKNAFFGGIVMAIENMDGFEKVLSRDLIHFIEEPLLQQPLPAATPPPVNYEKVLAQSHLLRIRRNAITATFFGGADWPLTIASGRSNSPNFFSYRKGAAVLKYMRLSTNYFSIGYFYSKGLKKDGNRYVLHNALNVPYYQPLPGNLRKKNGDYKLSESIDGRFWNKMDFENRPVSNVKTMTTTIALTENNGAAELSIDVTGIPGVLVTVELVFNEGGTLSGKIAAEKGNYFLEGGNGVYLNGADSIEFGPGMAVHRSIANLEGERYSTHFGSLRTDGMHVYLTGKTPFHHILGFR